MSWTRLRAAWLPLAAAMVAGQMHAQDSASARPEDVATIDGITRAVYASISGPAGQPRDWNRFRSLFIEGARLIPTGRGSSDGRFVVRPFSVEEYITRVTPGLERGFFEREIGRVEERFGNVVHFMSAYESRRAADDPEPFNRGVNSFQLFYDGERWWVVTIYWQAESAETRIPERYLNRP